MHGYFAVKGHNFGHFQQPNLDRYVQNTIFGRPITPKLTSEEYKSNTSMILYCNHIVVSGKCWGDEYNHAVLYCNILR